MKGFLFALGLLVFTGCASTPRETAPAPKWQGSFSMEEILGTPVASKKPFPEGRQPASPSNLNGVNFDGCYQLAVTGSMYPVVCFEGSGEEGINGSGLRMVFFGPNSDVIIGCGVASRAGIEDNSFFIDAEGGRQLTFSNITVDGGRAASGDATVGRAKLKFFAIPLYTARFMKIYHAFKACKGLGIGEVKNLRKD